MVRAVFWIYAVAQVLFFFFHHPDILGVNLPVYFQIATHNPSIISSAGNVFKQH
jgi:hypothetical protein